MAARIARAVGCFPLRGGDTDDVAVAESDETGEDVAVSESDEIREARGGDTDDIVVSVSDETGEDVAVSESDEIGETGESGGPAIAWEERAWEEENMLC
jgi:hypothetical protein